MHVPLSADERTALLRLARASIRDRLSGDGSLRQVLEQVELTAGLRGPRASFVTLKRTAENLEHRERLRGCIGSLTAEGSLYRDVIDNAVKSALEDPRFPPVGAGELPSLSIDISVLTPLQPVDGPEAIVIGRDGVQLEKDGRRSVFLPQVAPENNWQTPQLLEHLALKAGLPRDGWRGARLSVFRAEAFSER